MINRDYRTNWFLDKLLAGHVIYDKTTKTAKHKYEGVPIGYSLEIDNKVEYYIYNHYTFFVDLNYDKVNDKYMIVNFLIMPSSILQSNEPACSKNSAFDYMKALDHPKQTLTATLLAAPKDMELIQNKDSDIIKFEPFDVVFTYDVIFKPSDTIFTSRWDHYKHITGDKIHWYNLLSSILIILMFAVVVLYIFCRALKRDIEIYNTVI